MTDIVEHGKRDIWEVANQLGGYVGPDTPERLKVFLLKEEKAAADLAREILSLRSRAEKAEAERDKALDRCIYLAGLLGDMTIRDILDDRASIQATCEKLAAALEEALSYEPKDDSCAAWVPDAKAALSAYRNVTTVNASGPKGETPENCRDGGTDAT